MSSRTFRALVFIAILAVSGSALADKVRMKDGRVLEGKVEKEESDRILLRMKLGSVWLKRAEIESVEKQPDPIEEFERRAKSIAAADAAGWLDLAKFCMTAGLVVQSETCFRNALVADPGSTEAREGLEGILADRAVESVAGAKTSEEALETWPRIEPLRERGKEAFAEAIRARATRLEALVADRKAFDSWLTGELRSQRQKIRAIVMNERLYTDSAETTRRNVLEMVSTLNRMYDGPHDAGLVSLHPAAGRLIDEAGRLETILNLFDDKDRSAPDAFASALGKACSAFSEGMAAATRTPLEESNRRTAEANAEAAKKAGLSADESEGLRVVNEYRNRLGLGVLKFDESLFFAAKAHSKAMVEQSFFSHESPVPGMKTPYARIRKAGYDWRIAGENIAACEGGLTPQRALDAWINSPGHHRNLVRPEFEEAGLGVEGELWTLDLGARKKD